MQRRLQHRQELKQDLPSIYGSVYQTLSQPDQAIFAETTVQDIHNNIKQNHCKGGTRQKLNSGQKHNCPANTLI